AGAVVLVLLARVPFRWYLTRMGFVALFLGVFLIGLPFMPDPHGTMIAVGPLVLSQRGLEWALVLLVRALAMVTLMLVMLACAPIPVTIRAAHALHIPGLVVQLALLTYRYVFLLGDEFARLRTALRVRGYRNRPGLHSYRTIGQVAGTLLVR